LRVENHPATQWKSGLRHVHSFVGNVSPGHTLHWAKQRFFRGSREAIAATLKNVAAATVLMSL
jgi:hypothetical protein